MKLFGQKLQETARKLGLTNAEVALRANLSERRYGHYVTANREPDLATLVKIAHVLNTTPNDLLGFGGGAPRMSKHLRLLEKLSARAQSLTEAEIETVLILAEGLALRSRKAEKTKT